jgi:hypothetical protein
VLAVFATLLDDHALAREIKQFPAVYALEPPVIDGDLSDEVWKTAPLIDDFHQVDPIEFAPAEDSVEVRVLYDENNLYISARMIFNDSLAIAATKLAQGTPLGYNDDRFSVFLDPFNNRRYGYEFRLNPNGVREEGLFDGPGFVNTNWSGIWNARTRIREDGWQAELVIPFKTLNFNQDNHTWGISFGTRVINRGGTTQAWTSQSQQTRPGALGEMTGLSRAEQGHGLDIVPSLSLSGRHDHAGDRSDFKLEPSVDVFYKISPSLTAALTINTDFSAVEVDDRVVNLQRFSVFFPEKRAFFLQDADIFSFADLDGNGIPFFSRRIGLDENRAPVDIIGGVKLTGRAGPFNLGILNVRQESAGDDVNLFVGRASLNVFKESTLGLIVTDGSPVAGESNRVIGTDFNYLDRELIEGKSIRGSAWYMQSDTTGLSGDQDAFGIGLSIPQSAGVYGEAKFREIGEHFDPALGFVNRAGIRETSGKIAYRRYPELGIFQFIEASAQFSHIEDLDGNTESQLLTLTPLFFSNHKLDWFSFRFYRQREVLTEPFDIREGIVIAPGDYSWNKGEFWISSGEQRVLYTMMSINKGDFYDGTRMQIAGWATWQPSKHFSLSFGYDYNDIKLMGGEFISRLYKLKSSVAFSNTWSWTTLTQYDNDSNELSINSRIRWVPEAGRDVILVLNHLYVDDQTVPGRGRHFRSVSTDMVLKASYNIRF